VRHARLVLLDDLGLRAGIAAFWLRQLGYDVAVARLADALRSLRPAEAPAFSAAMHGVPAAEALQAMRLGQGRFVDVRSSRAYRAGHVGGAVWGIRPRLRYLSLEHGKPVYLIGDEPEVTALAARELHDLGFADVRAVEGGQPEVVVGGAAVLSSPETPGRQDAIDFLHFVHDRHDGNLDASRRYLAWEQGLIAQLDEAERAAFKLTPSSAG
jgi:rhodanese-related sulfurtransferase